MKLEERQRLHALSIADLNKELAEAEGHLLTYRFDAGLNRLSNPAGMHNTRKLIAVLKTLIREKELLAQSGFATMTEYKAYKVAERASYKASKG
ncbi:MAG: 50S ribosomal protein L29 [bacterium]